MVKFDFNQAPKSAIKYLENKGYKTSFHYDEIAKAAHHKSFTVAKVMRHDLLHDIFISLDTAIKEGKHFDDFKKDIKPTLQKKGWWGEQDIVNPRTGEVKTINIGSNRLRTIYKTNMRVAYATARYKEQMKLPNSIYLEYVSALLESTRTSHSELHGTVLPRDDNFWNINYPPNDWGCKCKTRAISKKEVQKRGLKISSKAPGSVASKDWSYNVGDTSKVVALSQMNLDKSLSELHSTTKNKAYESLAQAELLNIFYKKMGVKKGDLFIDKVGDPIVIDDNLFTSSSGHTKIKVKDRHLLLDEMIPTIKNPDEIYLEWDIGNITGEKRLVKKMFRYITIDGKKRAVVAMFEYLKNKTQGMTLHLLNTNAGVEKKRTEKLIYQRESD